MHHSALSKFFIGLASLSAAVTIYAAAVPNTASNPTTFLGPIARVGVTSPINEETAFSLLGEGGPNNWRIGGTMGMQINYNNRLKASAELLRQKITYSFFDGQQSPWVNQGAVGAAYEYDFHYSDDLNTLLTLSAYYSHAPSVTLGRGNGSYLDNGVTTYYTVYRHLAGSNASGVSPGITIIPWHGGSISGELNYDNVRYNNIYSNQTDPAGFGGTLSLSQNLTEHLNVNASGAMRKPFDNYQAGLSYDKDSPYGLWVFSLFGAYTYGKESLPNTYNIGLGVNYLIGATNGYPVPAVTMSLPPAPIYKDAPRYKDAPVYKDQPAPKIALPTEWDYMDPPSKSFLTWVSKPAVYMPQVLLVPDQKVTTSCTAPVFLGPVIDFVEFPPDGSIFTFDFSGFFAGENLRYTISATPPGYSINPVTGVLSGSTTDGDDVPATVTATNACGSASMSFEFTPD